MRLWQYCDRRHIQTKKWSHKKLWMFTPKSGRFNREAFRKIDRSKENRQEKSF
nr:MAG TPA_asm: hypothetical protein [Caudoviricetes sp.]